MTEPKMLIDCADCEFFKYPGECWGRAITDYTGELTGYEKCDNFPDCAYKRYLISDCEAQSQYNTILKLNDEITLLKDRCKLLQSTIDKECAACKNVKFCEILEKREFRIEKLETCLQEIKDIAETGLDKEHNGLILAELILQKISEVE